MDRIKPAAAVAALLLLAGCAGAPVDGGGGDATEGTRAGARAPAPSERPGRADRAGVRPEIARLATDLLGIPYRYGGTSPSEGFDCSGLVHYAYARAGVSVPRNSEALFNASRKIPLERASEADLVFFQDQAKLSHVGIYLGDGRFVHAPSSGKTVRISSLDSPYFRRHLVGVGRLIGN